MATRIFGRSDDLIEFEGDVKGEVGFWSSDHEQSAMVVCSDGSVFEVRYGKGFLGIWAIMLLNRGTLFDRIDPCTDADADPYSDVAHLRDGLRWAYVAKQWEQVK